jgi:hypothetical protein
MSAESNPLKFFTFFCAFALTFALVSLAEAQGPPKRSTHYNGTTDAYVKFDHKARYDSDINMTIEAWVYRERDDVNETIISHNTWLNFFDISFWFGFQGPNLWFSRSGGTYAESPISVPIHAWHHVAVTYDGETARFYLSGFFIGSAALSNDGANKELDLTIGATYWGENTTWPFNGYLDEVRLWSVVRTEDEIRNNMYVEIRDVPDLKGCFPGGGTKEYRPFGIYNSGTVGQGATERIIGILPRDLVVPRYPPPDPEQGREPMTLDGNVDLEQEYAGAEQMVIRYNLGGIIMDGNAYLIYTCGWDDTCNDGDEDEYLYIGIRDLRMPPPDRLWASWVAVNIDPNLSRDPLAQNSDFQVRAFMSEQSAKWFQGDDNGDFYEPVCTLFTCPPGEDKWMVAYGPPVNEFALAPQIEMRIHVSQLGLIDGETDGIMIIHANIANEGNSYPTPGDAVYHSPATWARMTYGGYSGFLVTISGHVYDTDTVNPASNYPVELGQGGAVLCSQTTDANGAYSFNCYMQPEQRIWIRVAPPCDDCQFVTPTIGGAGTPPVSVYPELVEFSWVNANTTLASVDFIYRHVGTISLTDMKPTNGAPRTRVREVPLKELSPERITIDGENLHRNIEVYLNKCPNRPFGAGCDPERNWFRARIVEFSQDLRKITVEVPPVPRSEAPGDWQWVVRDLWEERPSRVEWTLLEDPFHVTLHEYPLIHGFEFDNYRNLPWWEDFDGVFGRNGWIGCLRDPLYDLYFFVYVNWMSNTSGSCNGLSATSLLFARFAEGQGGLDAEDASFDTDETEGVHYASGLARDDETYRDQFCEPYRPSNLAARIQSYHGVQTSAEYIWTVLDQMSSWVGGGGSIDGDAVGVLDRVREHPQDYVVSMIPEIGRGHVVTPYAVTDQLNHHGESAEHTSQIWIYDNNFPQREPLVRRSIEIYHDPLFPPRYYLPRKTDPQDSDDAWQGQGIYSIPIGIFTMPHTAPGLLTLALVIHVLVFGDADSHVTSPDGEWGWRQDGTLVDNLRGARSITPTGGPNTRTRAVSLFLPMENAAPTVNSNVRGPHYFFHAANSGRMFQLEQFNGVKGNRDGFQTGYDNKMLERVSFTPQSRADNFRMRIGMITGDQDRAVFELAGLDVTGGQTAGFKALPGQRGIEFTNDTPNAVNPMYNVTTLDGTSATYAKNSFGPFEVPAGALQRVTVADWPRGQRLRSEIDLDRDGVFDIVSVLVPTHVPSLPAPDQLTASFLTPASVRLNWNDNSSNERGFLIERKTSLCASESDWRQIAVTDANTSTYTDNSVSSAATYSYRLRAYSGYAHSAYTRCVSVTTSEPCEGN